MQSNIKQYFDLPSSLQRPTSYADPSSSSTTSVSNSKGKKCAKTLLTEQVQQQGAGRRKRPRQQHCALGEGNTLEVDSRQTNESSSDNNQPKNVGQYKLYSEKRTNTWLKLYRWLVIKKVTESGDMRMFCNICIKTKQMCTFSHNGSKNFQHSTVERHQNSVQHRKAVKLLAMSTQAEKSFHVSKIKGEEYMLEKTARQKLHLRTTYWMSKEEIPSVKFTSLMKLQVSKIFILSIPKFMLTSILTELLPDEGRSHETSIYYKYL